MEETTNGVIGDLSTSSLTSGRLPVQTELIFPLLILILLTCSANIIVIVCVRRYRPLQKPVNLFVASLAMADFIVGIIAMPGMLVYTIFGYWPLSHIWCLLLIIPDTACSAVSVIHLCLIAYDRCLALAQPYDYRLPSRRRTVTIQICIAWFLGVVSCTSTVLLPHVLQQPILPNGCFFVPPKDIIAPPFVIFFHIPLVAMVVLYVRCVYSLQQRHSKINVGQSVPQVPAPTTQVSSLNIKSSQSGPSSSNDAAPAASTNERMVTALMNKHRQRRQEHRRSVRTLGIIIFAFLFCWLPFSIFFPIKSYCEDCISAGWFTFSYWVSYLNSTINPLLYFIGNKDFRMAFTKLFKC